MKEFCTFVILPCLCNDSNIANDNAVPGYQVYPYKKIEHFMG